MLAKIGADTAENEQHCAEVLPIGEVEPIGKHFGGRGLAGRPARRGRGRGLPARPALRGRAVLPPLPPHRDRHCAGAN